MSSRERRGGGVFGRHGVSDQTRKQRVARAPGFTGMTAVDVLGSVDELTDGTGGSVDCRHGGENRSISEIPVELPILREDFRCCLESRTSS